ncbi:P1 family peptidase [Alteromonas sp. C1M14]|uniref:P1 family peptidase n=1 Tax=Alteromonas sp. C1M14 TaxID=2841567 RepID=UPI001C086213|nr:P1 family peptidase [Alteromonas sp. C1M14]MBU2978239.1 P1 family peptidase [Alteromonas sp. C1M14]
MKLLSKVIFQVRIAAVITLLAGISNTVFASDDQSSLPIKLNEKTDRTLEYDWPILSVGTGEYPDGPTGLTVFHFKEKVSVAIDARGGGPSGVNAEYIKLGYDIPELDAIVFAGGSWYGLEAVTAVSSALKDDGLRDGNAFAIEPSIALSAGAIIFDFGSRRLNEIYPDKRLAQATFRHTSSGTFPMGATGAGRFAKSGAYFGCNAFSGQGGAFRQIGDIKIAVFTVVNSLGVIVNRDGVIQSCFKKAGMSDELTAKELISAFANSKKPVISSKENEQSSKNTTITLVVVNQKLEPALLQRLAVQVHTSMARAIQPFATIFDGDVLYAVSTNEIEEQIMLPHDLGVLAGEVAWDAVLNSQPIQPTLPITTEVNEVDVSAISGTYKFSRLALLDIKTDKQKVFARASGERSVYGIGTENWVELKPTSNGGFSFPSRYPALFDFSTKNVIKLNPGHWQQTGYKIN